MATIPSGLPSWAGNGHSATRASRVQPAHRPGVRTRHSDHLPRKDCSHADPVEPVLCLDRKTIERLSTRLGVKHDDNAGCEDWPVAMADPSLVDTALEACDSPESREDERALVVELLLNTFEFCMIEHDGNPDCPCWEIVIRVPVKSDRQRWTRRITLLALIRRRRRNTSTLICGAVSGPNAPLTSRRPSVMQRRKYASGCGRTADGRRLE